MDSDGEVCMALQRRRKSSREWFSQSFVLDPDVSEIFNECDVVARETIVVDLSAEGRHGVTTWLVCAPAE